MTTTAQAPAFTDNALKLLCERYLHQGEDDDECLSCGKEHETVDQFLDRISMGNPAYRTRLFEPLVFLPNSPTLFNLGTGNRGTLSACFKFNVDDSLIATDDSIMRVEQKAAGVLKSGGGVGYVFSDVRAKGLLISTTHGAACGPVAVMRHYDSLATLITQGGKREAAQMGILHVDHPDIREFIHCKDNKVDFKTFNISVALTDEFMQGVQEGRELAVGLFNEMVDGAWTHGDPGCFFIDTAERHNPTPWAGKLDGTNPCGEVPLLRNEPCNLGSINVAKFVTEGSWDYVALEPIIGLAIQYLDEVLDNNVFPDPSITTAALRTRKLGLGVAGFADALALMGVHYDSDEGVRRGENLMEFINRVAGEYSWHLGRNRDVAPVYAERGATGSPDQVYRNATRTCIAPTGTIAILMGASSGIEPHYLLKWDRRLGNGEVIQEFPAVLDEHGYVKELARAPGTGFRPKTAHEVEWQWHVKMQAAFQRHTDLAVSKTINLPNDATREDVGEAYMMMWELGCAGGTVYRDGSRDVQVLEAPGAHEVEATASPSTERRRLPDLRPFSDAVKFRVGEAKGYLHYSGWSEKELGEVFITMSKMGSSERSLYESVSMVTSIALQRGVPLEEIAKQFIGTQFEPAGLTGDTEIPVATSVLDYVFRRLMLQFGNGSNPINPGRLGLSCPLCSAPAKYEEGCVSCTAACGWERCG